jgi:hypothetical protein
MLEERRMYEEQELPSLTIKDKMNYPYLLAAQFLTIQKAMLNQEFSEREIKEAILGLVNMIPESWMDEDWNKQQKDSVIIDKIDVRPTFCGVPPSIEYCKDNGIIPFEEKETFDYYKLFHACVNLLDRRGIITRRAKIEKHLGERYDNDGHGEDR